jgi:flagellar assembly factor FliW
MQNSALNEEVDRKGYEVLDIRPDQIFTFSEGIPGFEKITQYCLLFNENEKPFAHLSALGGFNLEFIVVNPWLILPSYKPDVSDEEFKAIDSPQDKDLLVLAIVSLADNIAESTVNLSAPLIINTKNGKAKQVVIRNMDEYPCQHKINNE